MFRQAVDQLGQVALYSHPRKASDGIVKLQLKTNREKTIDVKLEEFQNKKYSKIDQKDDPVHINKYFTFRPSAVFEWQVVQVQMQVTTDLIRVQALHEDTAQWLNIQLKPKRAVYAREDHSKHGLVLVPATCGVQYVTDEKKLPDTNVVRLGSKKICGQEVWFYLRSQFSCKETYSKPSNHDWKKDFIAPYWLVQELNSESDATKINMERFSIPAVTGPFPIPCIRNLKVVKAGQQFVMAKLKKRCTKDDTAGSEPKKRK